MYISHLYPQAPLYGIGFSLGANVLTRYLAEEGEASRIIGACVLACVRERVFFYVNQSMRSHNSDAIALESQEE
jgi:predicted alpha/beta-fold hydrolase